MKGSSFKSRGESPDCVGALVLRLALRTETSVTFRFALLLEVLLLELLPALRTVVASESEPASQHKTVERTYRQDLVEGVKKLGNQLDSLFRAPAMPGPLIVEVVAAGNGAKRSRASSKLVSS